MPEEPFDFETLKVNGIKVNYYAICKRKLWLFSHFIRMEQDSEKVFLGKLLHETAYERLPRREISLDELVKFDVIEEGKVLEVKYSRRMRQAARLQLIYYLYYLKQRGIEMSGELRYPKEKRKEEIKLSEEDIRVVEETLKGIKQVEALPSPPQASFSSTCRSCSYAEFCWG